MLMLRTAISTCYQVAGLRMATLTIELHHTLFCSERQHSLLVQAVILGVGMTAAMLTVAMHSGTAGDLVRSERLSSQPLVFIRGSYRFRNHTQLPSATVFEVQMSI